MADEKYFQITVRIDKFLHDELLKLRDESGLSFREILGYSSQPCSCCPDTEVRAYNSKDKTVKIKRGLLYDALLTKYSSYNGKKL